MIELAQSMADQAGNPLVLFVVIVLAMGHVTNKVVVPLVKLRNLR